MLTPDEETYLSTLPAEKLVTILPWSPVLWDVAEQIMAEVATFHPEIEARFSGAAALGIAGLNDIDLDFMAPPHAFKTYLATFVSLFGEPRDTAPNTAVWTFYSQGIEIDLWLSDPASDSTARQWRLHCLLRNSPDLIREYDALKRSFDGKPYADYQRAKYEFYHRVLGE